MRVSLFLLMLMISLPALSGGSYFDAKIISFKEYANGTHLLSFYQMTNPYDSVNNKNPEEKHVLIDFGCSQKLACFTTERTFSEKQHIEAISKLNGLAKPGVVIQLGVMSSGFVPIKNKKDYYRAYGAFYDGERVYLYANSHL